MAFDQVRPIFWRRSTKSLNGNCVEVAFHDGKVLIRDSKNRDGGIISASPAVWQKFIASIQQQ